jgi:trk system potassium uptake protein TrkA
VLHGDGSDAEALDLAGLTDMDTFITATGENETNIMSCMLAKHLMTHQWQLRSKDRKTISLVNKEEYLVLAATSGSDIALNKKVLAANEILKFIRRGELLSVAHLHGFDAEVVEIHSGTGFSHHANPAFQNRPVFSRKNSHRRCLPGRTMENCRGRYPHPCR